MKKNIAGIKLSEKYPALCGYIEESCSKCEKNCDVPSINMFSCLMKKVAEKSNFVTKPEQIDEIPIISLKKPDDIVIEHKEKANNEKSKKNQQYVSQGKCWFTFETEDEADD
jgi:hypothetical protein